VPRRCRARRRGPAPGRSRSRFRCSTACAERRHGTSARQPGQGAPAGWPLRPALGLPTDAAHERAR
jgi:hypothetical protein